MGNIWGVSDDRCGAVLERVHIEAIPISAAVALGIFCEPSQGVIDFTGFGIAEQDMFPALLYYREVLARVER